VQNTVVWLTGLSGAGKSTLAMALERRLSALHHPVARLDGDELRRTVCADLGFGPEDRAENVRRASVAAVQKARDGLVCIAALISPFAADRAKARVLAASEGVRFLEVFVDAPLEVCERRDPKGLYRRARAGAIQEFTGLSSPYEAPDAPEVHLHTDQLTLDDCVAQVLAAIIEPHRPA